MITKCVGRDFKGLSFEQPLGRLNLLVGPNGSGKSARTQALILAVMGYIPGGAKKNAEILGSYGTEDTMVVGFEAEKVLHERGFVRKVDSVSQGYKVGGKPAKEGDFLKALALHGNPRIVDISAFMDLSDQKKIDAAFSLYPPAGDINKIQGEIDSLKEKINTLNAKAKTSEAAAARLVAAKPPLPAGTLADVTGKIAETAENLRVARKELVALQVAEGARLAKEKAEKKAAEDAQKLKEKLEREAAEKAKKEAEPPPPSKEPLQAPGREKGPMETLADKTFGKYGKPIEHLMVGPSEDEKIAQNYLSSGSMMGPAGNINNESLVGAIDYGPMIKAAASIQAILDALKAAGCESCAARLVAIRELRKYQGVKV